MWRSRGYTPGVTVREVSSDVFRPEVVSVRAARRFLQENLADVSDEMRDTAVLLVSELATNSVRHAATSFSVSLLVAESTVRVEVADWDATMPVAQVTTRRDVDGRGLAIVARLAADWGVEPVGGGKVVWFMLR
jgi:two-component sensor histidine kinase